MNSQMFSNLLFVISVTVTFAARLTDDQLAQILNEKLDRGPASESKDYAPLDDISELKRRIFALESLGDITDQMLDTGNGRSDTEDVLSLTGKQETGPASEITNYLPPDDLSDLKRRILALEKRSDRMLHTGNERSTEDGLHSPHDRREDLSTGVFEKNGRLPSNVDVKNILSEDTGPDDERNLNISDGTQGADTSRQHLLLKENNDLNSISKKLYSTAMNICGHFTLALKGSFSKCLREHGLGPYYGDCVGRQCNWETPTTTEDTDKRSLVCGRYGCKMKTKRIMCNTFGCKQHLYAFLQQPGRSLLGRILNPNTYRNFICFGSLCQVPQISPAKMKLFQSSLNDKVTSDPDLTLSRKMSNDSRKEDFNVLQSIKDYVHESFNDDIFRALPNPMGNPACPSGYCTEEF